MQAPIPQNVREKLRELQRAGTSLYVKLKFAEAIPYFDQMLQYHPTNIEALTFRAESYLGLGYRNEAMQDFDTVVKLEPHEGYNWEQRAKAKMKVGLYSEAVKDYEQADRLNPNSKPTLEALAEARDRARLAQEKRAQEAIALDIMNMMQQAQPQRVPQRTPQQILLEALSLFQRMQFQAALPLFDQVIALAPASREAIAALVGRAGAKEGLGLIKEAIRDYDQAITFIPSELNYWQARAEAKVRFNDPQGAINDMRQLVELYPDSPRALIVREKVHQFVGDFLVGRAGEEERLHETDKAIQSYNQAIELIPTEVNFWRKRAEAKIRFNHPQEAIDEMHQLVQYPNDNNPRAWLVRAGVHQLVGNFREALLSFEEALARDDRSTEARKGISDSMAKMNSLELALYYFQKQDFKTAIKHADTILKNKIDKEFYGSALFICANSYNRLNYPEKSVPYLLRALKDDAKDFSTAKFPEKVEAYKKAQKILASTKKLKANDEQLPILISEVLEIASTFMGKTFEDRENLANSSPTKSSPRSADLSSDDTQSPSNTRDHSPSAPPPGERTQVLDSKPPIPFSEIRFGKVIGEGEYGKVYYATWNQQPVAVKTTDKYGMAGFIAKECRLLGSLTHPNIVQAYGYSIGNAERFCFVMNYFPNGPLADFIYSKKWETPTSWLMQSAAKIASAIEYLHNNNVIHGDITSSNALVDQHFNVALSDFGCAHKLAEGQTSVITDATGALVYRAPEVFAYFLAHGNFKVEKPNDIFSLGMLIWVCFTKQIPFAKRNEEEVMCRASSDEVKLREKIPPNMPKPLAKLITGCWQHKPSDRLTASNAHEQMAAVYHEGTQNSDRQALPTLRK